MISQMTPAGYRPAMRARSTAASVCPARTMHAAGCATAAETCGPAAPDPPACVAGSIAASTVAARSAAEMPVVVRSFASIGTQNAGFEPRACSADHQRNLELVEPLRRHRQADQAAAVARHEVDRLRRDLLRRDRQVAFVLPILVVDDDDHLACAERLDRVLDAGERIGRASGEPLAISSFLVIGRARSGQCVDSPARSALPSVSPRQLRGADDVLPDHVAFEVDAVARLRRWRRLVCASVYGTICTSNRSAPRPATVRLMPSTAIDPCGTKYGASCAGNPTVSHSNSASAAAPRRGRSRRRGPGRNARRTGCRRAAAARDSPGSRAPACRAS